jgi:hypothetical protein
MSCHQNAGQNHNLKIANKPFENVGNSNIWEQHLKIKTAFKKKVRED